VALIEARTVKQPLEAPRRAKGVKAVLIITDYDASALSAPQSFRDGIQAAINILDSTFIANVTVKIEVGYGEYNGTTLSDQRFSAGGFTNGISLSYSTLRADLIANSDIDSTSTSLPNTATVNGVSSFVISRSQERIFGILPQANTTATDDGIIGMGTNFTGNVLISGALHEITHALGRIDGQTSLSLFRFTSQGNRLFTNSVPSAAAYFSMNNGVTDLADFGTSSDPGDFLSGFRTPNDPFNESVGNLAALTTTDIEIMDALGFRTGAAALVSFAPNDLNDDGMADVFWRSTAGVADWQMNGSTVSGAYIKSGGVAVNPDASWIVVGISDFNNDGKADILWRNTSGALSDWTMNGSVIASSAFVTSGGSVITPDASWSVSGVGDFNHDGASDILWRNANGATAIWYMNGSSISSNSSLLSGGAAVDPDPSWSVAGIGDFNGDGTADILWRNVSGATVLWTVNGTNITSSASLTSGGVAVNPDPSWSVAGIGDFNADHITDVLWRNASGSVIEWLMNGSAIVGSGALTSNGVAVSPDASWHIVEVGDFSGDGRSDVLWRNNSGLVVEWLMNGTQITSSTSLANPDAAWTVQNKPADFA
jgi:FG-GAP-like repeat